MLNYYGILQSIKRAGQLTHLNFCSCPCIFDVFKVSLLGLDDPFLYGETFVEPILHILYQFFSEYVDFYLFLYMAPSLSQLFVFSHIMATFHIRTAILRFHKLPHLRLRRRHLFPKLFISSWSRLNRLNYCLLTFPIIKFIQLIPWRIQTGSNLIFICIKHHLLLCILNQLLELLKHSVHLLFDISYFDKINIFIRFSTLIMTWVG
jgi:hypothetical protein